MLAAMQGLRSFAASLWITVLLMSTASCRDTSTPPSSPRADVPPPAAVELKVGDPAPPFSLPGSDGKTYTLADYKGRQAVVLAWFAKAFSSA
jgi:hypothetical protein